MDPLDFPCRPPNIQADADGLCLDLVPHPSDGGGDARSLFACGDWASIRIHADAAQRAPRDLYGERLAREIAKADLSIVNLECCLGGNKPLPKDGPNLKGDPGSPRALKSAGFDLAVLANNHLSDYLEEGVRATLDACAEAGLASCGAGMDLAGAFRPHISECAGVRIGVFAACDREDGEATLFGAGTACLFDDMLHERIRALREQCDILVLVVHGGREYVPVPPPYWRNRVLAAASCGADLVVGHHPHVPQGATLLRRPDGAEVPVFFSTGNFVFRPAAASPGLIPPHTDLGFAIHAGFVGKRLRQARMIPYRIEGEAGPRALPASEMPVWADFYQTLSDPLADAGLVEAWFDAVSDHFWAHGTRERLEGLTAKLCKGDVEAMTHGLGHHLSCAHHTLLTRAMQRVLMGTSGSAPGEIVQNLGAWFQGVWPATSQ